MQISKTTPSSQLPKSQPAPTKSTEASKEKGTVLRDLVSIGGGAGAGTVGGLYGMAEGTVRGGRANYPAHIKKGAQIGKAVLTPLGGALGAIAAGVAIGAAAVGAPIAAGLATGLGFIGGTAISAVVQAPSTIAQTAGAGARVGVKAGRALGSVGAVLGTMVGGAFGAVGGVFASGAKGLPKGVELGKSGAQAGANLVTGLPQFSKNAWNISYKGSRAAFGGLGAVVGGTAGVVTATGETILDGIVGGIRRGAQWGQSTSEYLQGDSTPSPTKD